MIKYLRDGQWFTIEQIREQRKLEEETKKEKEPILSTIDTLLDKKKVKVDKSIIVEVEKEEDTDEEMEEDLSNTVITKIKKKK